MPDMRVRNWYMFSTPRPPYNRLHRQFPTSTGGADDSCESGESVRSILREMWVAGSRCCLGLQRAPQPRPGQTNAE